MSSIHHPAIRKEIMKKILCWVLGHNMYKITGIDSGRSRYGQFKCSRCFYKEGFNMTMDEMKKAKYLELTAESRRLFNKGDDSVLYFCIELAALYTNCREWLQEKEKEIDKLHEIVSAGENQS
jgi:hypothetical protein